MKKLILCLWLAALGLMACACGSSAPSTASQTREAPVHLNYLTIGTPDEDLALVNEKLNELLREKINVTVDYVKVDWGEYESHLAALIDSGKPFDVAFATNYTLNARKGAFLPLNELLRTIGRETYQVVHPTFWEGVAIDGVIYGVPTNKELAVLDQWMYPKELIDKYEIDISQYRTLESLAPLFEMISEREPEYLVMELDRDSHNFFSLYGYEYVVEKTLPLVLRSLDEELVIYSAFELEECRDFLRILREYYLAGYINQDAALYRGSSLSYGKKVFLRIASGGPYPESAWSQLRGYDVVAMPVTDAVVTTEATRAGVMSVSATTKHPEACMAFLNCINTDAQVRNLLNYGIEGVHYTLSSEGQVISESPRRYTGVQYTQGNWFILHTQGGAVAEPLDKWEQYEAYNESAKNSQALGFTPDLAAYSQQVKDIAAVWETYYPSLMTGSVDVDVYLPMFVRELNEAGLAEVREGLQTQLEAWVEKAKAS